MTKQRTAEPDESRLEELEDDIKEIRDREARRRKEAAADKMRFATPEAYAAAMMDREEALDETSETERSLRRAAEDARAKRKGHD